MTAPAGAVAGANQGRIKAAAACAIGMVFNYTPFVMVGMSVFMKPMSKDLGWGRGTVSSLILTASLVAAAASPFYGRLLDRRPPHAIVAASLAVLGAGIIALGLLPPSAFAYYAVFVLFGLTLMPSLLAFPKVTAAWFERRRGLAVGLFIGAAASLGAGLAPSLAAGLIARFGWRGAYVGLGLIVLLVTAPAMYAMLRLPPKAQGRAAPAAARERRFDFLRTREFWLIFVAICFFWLAVNGFRIHLVALVTDRGLTVRDATTALAFWAAGSFMGHILVGWAMDEVRSPKVVIPFFVLALAGFVLCSRAATPTMLDVGGLVTGLGLGAEVTLAPLLVTAYFGVARTAEVYGFTQVAASIASTLGPVAMGVCFDRTGSYALAIHAFEVCLALCVGLIALLGPYPSEGAPRTMPSTR